MKGQAILSVVMSVLLLILGACSTQAYPPERPFEIEQLLIDDSFFPSGWAIDPEGPFVPPQAPLGGYNSIERIGLNFYVQNGVAIEDIHRFRSKDESAEEFKRWQETRFSQREIDTPWTVPRELPYRSLVADQFYFACAQEGGTPMCRFLGQYEEYLVLFNTQMSPRSMSYTDVERILRAIDERMAHYLGSE